MKNREFLDVRNFSVQANTILNTFYTWSLMRLATSYPTFRIEKAVDRYRQDLDFFFNDVIEEHARILFWYLAFISGREAAHLTREARRVDTNERHLIAELWSALSSIVDYSSYDRYQGLANAFRERSDSDIEELLRLWERTFYEPTWPSSYGGHRWGDIARAARRYWTGETSTLVFVDTVFTLRHNGGRLFDKLHTFSATNEFELFSQLEVQSKARSIYDLVHNLSRLWPYWEFDCIHLLRRGVTFGWWGNDLIRHCKYRSAILKPAV